MLRIGFHPSSGICTEPSTDNYTLAISNTSIIYTYSNYTLYTLIASIYIQQNAIQWRRSKQSVDGRQTPLNHFANFQLLPSISNRWRYGLRAGVNLKI